MQTWAALGLMGFFLALFVHVQPYRTPVLNQLELYALTADFVTLFLGLGLFNNAKAGEMRSEAFAQIFSVLVVVVNLVFVFYLIYVIKHHSEYVKKGKELLGSFSKKKQEVEEVWTTNPSFKVEHEVKTLSPKRSASQLIRSKKLLELHQQRGVEMVASRRTATFESLRHWHEAHDVI